jgi:hypothetical protein
MIPASDLWMLGLQPVRDQGGEPVPARSPARAGRRQAPRGGAPRPTTTQDHSPTEVWYRRRMAEHRRGLVRHWPWVFAALGVAVVIGLVSPDRSKPHAPQASAPAVSVK